MKYKDFTEETKGFWYTPGLILQKGSLRECVVSSRLWGVSTITFYVDRDNKQVLKLSDYDGLGYRVKRVRK